MSQAPVVKRISRDASDVVLRVRVLPGAPYRKIKGFLVLFNINCGYGLVVEHVLAKDETGVRFSLPAPKDTIKDKIVLIP